MICPNISFFRMIVTDWTGPLICIKIQWYPQYGTAFRSAFYLVSFCSFHIAIKNCYNVHFMKIKKIDAKIDFSAKNSKKFVYYNEELVTNSKLQTQLSRKLQRFRTCRKKKKCSNFHELFEYQQKLFSTFFPLDQSFKARL